MCVTSETAAGAAMAGAWDVICFKPQICFFYYFFHTIQLVSCPFFQSLGCKAPTMHFNPLTAHHVPKISQDLFSTPHACFWPPCMFSIPYTHSWPPHTVLTPHAHSICVLGLLSVFGYPTLIYISGNMHTSHCIHVSILFLSYLLYIYFFFFYWECTNVPAHSYAFCFKI